MSFFAKYIVPEAAALRNSDSYRIIPPIDDGAAREIVHAGARLLNLASNNYLGLANRPEIIEVSAKSLARYGCSSGASRLITGNFALAETLEAELATFKDQEAALVTGSGYAANLAVFSALADRHTVILSDKLNHASIIDGITLSGAKLVRYPHLDMDHLEHLLEREQEAPKKIIVTDTVFSMDGDVAPLARLVELGKAYGALIVVTRPMPWVFRPGTRARGRTRVVRGRGCARGHLEQGPGVPRGYVAAGWKPSRFCATGAGRLFFPLPCPRPCSRRLAALRHIKANPKEGEILLGMAKDIRDHLRGLGFDTMGSSTQIIPVACGRNRVALHAQALLRSEGLLVAAVRPPTVPQGAARLRLSLRAALTEEDLKRVRLGFSRLRVSFFP